MKQNQKLLLRAVSLILLTAALASCTIKYVHVKKDYEIKEKNSLKRVALAMAPTAKPNPQLNKLVLAVLREYLSIQKDYIIYPLPKSDKPKAYVEEYCGKNPKLNGVLVNRVRELKKQNGKVELGIQATLYDCKDYDRIWESYGRGKYTSNDDGYTTLIKGYSDRIGKDVEYLVAPVYILVRKIYDSMPSPVLTEEEKEEKIDVMI